MSIIWPHGRYCITDSSNSLISLIRSSMVPPPMARKEATWQGIEKKAKWLDFMVQFGPRKHP